MKIRRYNSFLFQYARSILSLVILFIVTILIHEGAHYAAALIFRVQVDRFTWFDRNYLAPAFFSSAPKDTLSVTIANYSGGLVTGILLLTVLLIWRKWFQVSLYRWLLGLYLVAFGFWQVSQGILEGAFHQSYILNSTALFSPISFIGYGALLLGVALYWIYVPRLSET